MTAISKHKINIPTPIMAVSELPYAQFRLVFWLTLMTPWIVFLVLIWPLALCRTKGPVSVSTARIRGINSKIRGGEVQHTGVVPFLKKFESTVRCVHKMVSEEDQQPFTSPSGTKRSKTSSSSRTTKGQKTTG